MAKRLKDPVTDTSPDTSIFYGQLPNGGMRKPIADCMRQRVLDDLVDLLRTDTEIKETPEWKISIAENLGVRSTHPLVTEVAMWALIESFQSFNLEMGEVLLRVLDDYTQRGNFWDEGIVQDIKEILKRI